MPIRDWSGASRAAYHNFYLSWLTGPESFIEPVAFGASLPEMPLEATHQDVWDRLPEPLRPPQRSYE